MSSTIRETIALVTVSEARSVLLVDAPTVSSNSDRYQKQNLLGYYILINTWLLLMKEYTAYGWISVKDRIFRRGLLDTIAYFDDCASRLVQDQSLTESYPLGEQIYREVQRNVGRLPLFTDTEKAINSSPLATALQLFRYPKRFSPLGTDKLAKECYDDFIAEQNRLKLLQRRSHSWYLVSRVRSVIRDLLPWDEICERLFDLDITDIEFTHGAGSDAKSSIGSKLRACSRVLPDYFISWARPAYPVGVYHIHDNNQEDNIAVVRAVPKTYKKARIIAMEETYRQALAKRVFSVVSRYLPEMINIHDQTRNQVMAREGSMSGQLATIDLSRASDDIQVNLIYELFPLQFVDFLEQVRPTHYDIDGRVRQLQSYMTMGNAMTFVLETIVFYAIAYSAVELCDGRVQDVSAYGDDIIVPSDCFETACEFLTHFGFVVNQNKSYGSGPYRESCGEEYWNGIPVSTYYFPRFAVEGEIGKTVKVSSKLSRDGFTDEYFDSTTRLVDLQHKLMVASPAAGKFVAAVLCEAHPNITSSLIRLDSHTPDLWDFDELHKDAARSPRIRALDDGTYRVTAGPLTFIYPDKASMERVWTGLRVEDKLHINLIYGPRTSYELPSQPSESDIRLMETYCYNMFLKYGPSYDDELLRLLGVSSPSLTKERCFGRAVMKWGYRVD